MILRALLACCVVSVPLTIVAAAMTAPTLSGWVSPHCQMRACGDCRIRFCCHPCHFPTTP
jgi:hypothetical protein